MRKEDLDKNVSFVLSDVSRLLRKRFDQRAAKLGLTRAQWRVLAHIGLREGINQSALADILEVENITLGRHIDRLQDSGWVERRSDPDDRRAWRLFIMDKALPIMRRMQVISVDTRAEALDGFSAEEEDLLLGALLRVKSNLLNEDNKDENNKKEEADKTVSVK
ncbi:MAG: DNA-binding MarR family transcriptional regulator [Alphaproteobacteria bacterium]|jgi:MarR family transcriptional regulator for hemolysin